MPGLLLPLSEQHLPEADIDHPSHENWWAVSDRWLTENKYDLWSELLDRMPTTDDEFIELWDAMEIGLERTNAYRVTHERLNSALVADYAEYHANALLPGPADAAGEALAKRAWYSYETLAGHNITLEQYIPWIGRAALSTFANLPARLSKIRSISLEVGGVSQAGNWEGTERLDAIVESLPRRLELANPGLNVEPFPRNAQRHYQFIPMRQMVGRLVLRDDRSLQPGEREFLKAVKRLEEWQYEDLTPEFAMIRRRRPVFDVAVPDGERVRIFKQSVALLPLRFLPAGLYELAVAASRTYPEYEQLSDEQKVVYNRAQQRIGQLAAQACGAVFERAIRERDYTAVPLSMQYVAKVKRPIEGSNHSGTIDKMLVE